MTQAERIAYEARQAERDAVDLDRLTASMRSAYMLQPKVTETGFEKALPRLLLDMASDVGPLHTTSLALDGNVVVCYSPYTPRQKPILK